MAGSGEEERNLGTETRPQAPLTFLRGGLSGTRKRGQADADVEGLSAH